MSGINRVVDTLLTVATFVPVLSMVPAFIDARRARGEIAKFSNQTEARTNSVAQNSFRNLQTELSAFWAVEGVRLNRQSFETALLTIVPLYNIFFAIFGLSDRLDLSEFREVNEKGTEKEKIAYVYKKFELGAVPPDSDGKKDEKIKIALKLVGSNALREAMLCLHDEDINLNIAKMIYNRCCGEIDKEGNQLSGYDLIRSEIQNVISNLKNSKSIDPADAAYTNYQLTLVSNFIGK